MKETPLSSTFISGNVAQKQEQLKEKIHDRRDTADRPFGHVVSCCHPFIHFLNGCVITDYFNMKVYRGTTLIYTVNR